jgi:plasmid maintenance system antidote protein VapI
MGKKPKKPTRMERIILKAIKDSGMTQLELSARSGVPQPTLCRFMDKDPTTRRTVTLPVADRLCKILGLKLQSEQDGRKERDNA